MTEVSAWAREIVAKRVVITTTLAAVLSFCVSQGIISDKIAANVDGAIAVGFTLLVALVSAFWASTGVTPADPALAPMSKNNIPLVESAPTEPAPEPIDTPADPEAPTGLPTVTIESEQPNV
jgi:hypothetical protein